MANPVRPTTPAAPSAQADDTDLKAHIQALRRYARALVANNPDDADDLVQETLKRALIYLDGRREIRNLRSYLLTMLHHARVDLANRRSRDGDWLAYETCRTMASGPIQADRLVCGEAVDAIERLPEEQRAVLLLVGLEGLAYQEVADVLRIPIGTVMSRLNRGRKNLRKILGLEDITMERIANQLEGGAFLPETSRKPVLFSSDLV